MLNGNFAKIGAFPIIVQTQIAQHNEMIDSVSKETDIQGEKTNHS